MQEGFTQQMISIVKDIKKLYVKYFFNWFVVKILSYISAFVIAVLMTLPFLGAMFLYARYDAISWGDLIMNILSQSQYESIFLQIAQHPYHFGGMIFLGMSAFLAFIIGFSYYFIPLMNGYISYDEEDEVKVLGKGYFNLSLLGKYSVIAWLSIVIMFLPTIVSIGLLLAMIYLLGGVSEVYAMIATQGEMNIFTITSFVLVLVSLVGFFYLAYRCTYASLVLVDKKRYPDVTIWFCMKESFALTSGVNIFKIIFILLIFTLVITLPLDYIGRFAERGDEILQWIYIIVSFILFQGLMEFVIYSSYKNVLQSPDQVEQEIEN